MPRTTSVILIVEAYGVLETSSETFVVLDLWITAQAVKQSSLKAQLLGAQVPVHYRDLQYQDLVH